MDRYVNTSLTLLVFYLHLELGLSQLPLDQVSTMNRVYDIFENTSGGSSFVWRNFSKESGPCSWRGVSCTSDNSSIVSLSFSSFSISASEFLPVICQIGSLVSLDVSNNHLSSIPDAFFAVCGEIIGLRVLNFSRNKLSGSLPTFSGFRTLEFLDVSHNSLSGEIDSRLSGLDALRSLNLTQNKFIGNIPTNLGRLNLLEELQLSFNGFVNEIPRGIVRYRNLTLIDLGGNGISGSIPHDLGQLTKLEVLVLSGNNFSGSIPNSISNITRLFRFAANQNSFNGTIPYGIANFLRSLDLSYNRLTGTIPSDLLSSPTLQVVDLSNNELEGSIPSKISTSLFRLRLGSNSLNGTLPSASLRSLVDLTYLELDNNTLTGTIPSELSLCKNLALLNLAQNRLTGPVPSSLGDLVNLQVLNLQLNNLVGEIPPEIALLNKLEKLNLSMNSLNGSIPISVTSLRNLTNLYLQGNNLSGQIPDSIGSLSLLIELQLGNNLLSGRIPEMPPNLQISLNLSHNNFSGLIPVTLSRLGGLEVLDLSNNRFSGEIPNFLTGMRGLTHLLLSNNQFTGVVPRFGQYVQVETNGNNVSISPAENPTPASQSQRKRKSLASYLIIAVPTAAAAVILLIIISLFISRRYYRINDEYLHSGQEITPPLVIHGNLLTPNSIHRSNIDFPKAMEAVSDPSNVIMKTRFSTYYKVVMPSGTSYFVKKLNWSDKIFQSGSHERFGEELEVLGKLCNSNVMIPLAYVLTLDSAFLFYNFLPESSLSDVLHINTANTLDWLNRYSIAIGVAQGLAFLHGCNSGPILLLDLSSKSILLKSLNESQIGDIELCKVIDPSKSTGSLSTVAGSVGYIPPEYAYTMRVTAAGNVYSFGVVLLELLTGKPAVSGVVELAKWVLSNNMQQNKLDKILDFSVSKTSVAVRSQMLAVLKVALACISMSPGARPNMKSVLRMLLNAR